MQGRKTRYFFLSKKNLPQVSFCVVLMHHVLLPGGATILILILSPGADDHLMCGQELSNAQWVKNS